MADMTLTAQFLMRNDTETNWKTISPILGKGEMGVESNTHKFKFGDGTSPWNDLPYASARAASVFTVDPTTSDVNYDIGSIWVNVSTKKVYIFMGIVDGSGVWKSVTTKEDLDSLSITVTGDAEAAAQNFSNSKITLNLALKKVIDSGTYAKVTVNEKGLVTGYQSLTLADITDAGTAAKANIGSAEGNVVVVSADGKIDSSLLPALAISQPFAVADELEMLALNAQTGDIAIRSDISRCFILKEAPANTLSNWLELLVPASTVLSVNGRTGAVSLNTDAIPEGSSNLYYTEARATANFDTNFAAKNVADLADGANYVSIGDVLILDGGSASGNAKA